MKETEIIDLLKPIATNDHSLNLDDDAAIIPYTNELDYILTKDTITSGTHFFETDAPETIAQRLIRSNLSDLAAMGATPTFYLLSLALPEGAEKSWLDPFKTALNEDMKEYGGLLIGGDTVTSKSDTTLSLTAIGTVKKGAALLRSKAIEGDLIWVTGTLGDQALGLKLHQNTLTLKDESATKALKAAYHHLTPPIKLAPKLLGTAHAATDISDGLQTDLKNLCASSSCGAEINEQDLPLSEAAQKALTEDPALIETIKSGGDDYQLLFTTSPSQKEVIKMLASMLNLKATPIGQITNSPQIAFNK